MSENEAGAVGADFEALVRGEGCPMCEPGADETPFGVRILEGRWSDAYLGRYPVRPGYAFVIWKGRHVAEPTELSDEEAAGFWGEVADVARAVGRAHPARQDELAQPGQRRAPPPRPPGAPPGR